MPVRPLQSPACSASRWEAGEAKAIDDKVIKAPKKTAVMILRFISRILLVTSRRADDTAPTRLTRTMLANDPQRVLEGLADFLDVLALAAAGAASSAKVFGRYAKLPFEVTRQVALICEPYSARNLRQ